MCNSVTSVWVSQDGAQIAATYIHPFLMFFKLSNLNFVRESEDSKILLKRITKEIRMKPSGFNNTFLTSGLIIFGICFDGTVIPKFIDKKHKYKVWSF